MAEGQTKDRAIRIIYPRNNGPRFSTEEAAAYQAMNLSQGGIRLDCLRMGSSFQEKLDEMMDIRATDSDRYKLLMNFYVVRRAFVEYPELTRKFNEAEITQLQEDYRRLKITGKLSLLSDRDNPLKLEGIISGWHETHNQILLRISDERTIDEEIFRREALYVVKSMGFLTGTDGKQMGKNELLKFLQG